MASNPTDRRQNHGGHIKLLDFIAMLGAQCEAGQKAEPPRFLVPGQTLAKLSPNGGSMIEPYAAYASRVHRWGGK